MRPAGEIRAALLGVPPVHGPCTLRALVERSQVGYDAALYTVKNLVRCGALQKVGRERVAHAKQWVALYDVPEGGAAPEVDTSADVGVLVLGDALARWR